MSGERLLVVEDEAHLSEVISDNLRLEGWRVDVVADGATALSSIRGDRPDLVLLDVMLPRMDGFAVCDALRKEGNDVPILFLTARASSDDRVQGLALGGDDYLSKPFELKELILRVKAILRRTEWFRTPSPAGDTLELGAARVDFRTNRAQVGERSFELSPKETMILRCLAERPGEVVSRADILDRVWGYDAFPTSRTVDNFIVRLRKRFERDAANPQHFLTVWGVGYRFIAEPAS